MTVGVRGAVLDADGRVFLVQHSYVPGWHLPGGGVEPGETVREALARELREEANVVPTDTPVLHGIFFNRGISRRDHVVVFVVRAFETLGPRPGDWEIVEAGFFPLDDLPAGKARPTRARLAEILNGVSPPQDW